VTWTPPCVGPAGGRTAGLGDQGGDDPGEQRPLLLVDEGAARVEGLVRQSSASLSAPGSEALYSGVEMRTASAAPRRRAQPGDGRERRLDVGVLAVVRKLPQVLDEVASDPARELPCRGVQQHPVVRVAAQAAAEGDEAHG
jgi:hypothetical protein